MTRKNDSCAQLVRAVHSGVEVVDFEPEQDAVAVRLVVGIRNSPVVVFNVERMQLEDQGFARNQALVRRPAVCALTAQEALIPQATVLDITDDDQGLKSHR